MQFFVTFVFLRVLRDLRPNVSACSVNSVSQSKLEQRRLAPRWFMGEYPH
jgi:hypothetical protein